MRFIISETQELQHQYGKWNLHYEGVEIYDGGDHLVIYQGYTIEQPIEELAPNFEKFRDANGNFFAVKVTPDTVEVQLDYFNNHKIFYAEKYGQEWTNHLPWMIFNKNDIVRDSLYDEHKLREFTNHKTKTFFGHINSLLPDYDYIGDCREAFNTTPKREESELTEYIHECMIDHTRVIKEKYPKRFISLSEGIDSALQSCYFKEDPQYIYAVTLCDAGVEGLHYKTLAASNFDNVTFDTFDINRSKEFTLRYLKDSTTRFGDFLPTMMQIEDCEEKPDIVMYGANGDEMFVRDLAANILMVGLEVWDDNPRIIFDNVCENLYNKRYQYGSRYSLGLLVEGSVDEYTLVWLSEKWFNKVRTQEDYKNQLLYWLTPKFYTRVISQNNNVITASLYNDRRIYHEVLKMDREYLTEKVMDCPIQRKLLKEKFNYTFKTPYKDALLADYDDINNNIFEATVLPLFKEYK